MQSFSNAAIWYNQPSSRGIYISHPNLTSQQSFRCYYCIFHLRLPLSHPLLLRLRLLLRPLLCQLRLMAAIAGEPQAREHHDGHEDDGERGTTGDDPAHALDLGLGVGVEGDSNFIVEFLDLGAAGRVSVRDLDPEAGYRRETGEGARLQHSPYSSAPSEPPSCDH